MLTEQQKAEMDAYLNAERAIGRINGPIPSRTLQDIREAAYEYIALQMLHWCPEDFARSGSFGWYSQGAKIEFRRLAKQAIRSERQDARELWLCAVARWYWYDEVWADVSSWLDNVIKAEKANESLCASRTERLRASVIREELEEAREKLHRSIRTDRTIK